MAPAVWWIRRDLRLKNNSALRHALASGRPVIPLFILDQRLLNVAGPNRLNFLYAGLQALDQELRLRGSRLVVRRGKVRHILRQILAETNAEAIYAEEDFTPYARERDDAVGAAFPLKLIHGQTYHPPGAVLNQKGEPYTIFSPYSKAWKALPLVDLEAWLPPERFPPMDLPPGDVIPDAQVSVDFPASEAEAQSRLAAFLNGPVFDYAEHRDRLDLDGTSSLSPYFHFGMITTRQAAHAVLQISAPTAEACQGCIAWLNELIWREFYIQILFRYPEVLKIAFNPRLRNICWRDSLDELRAWQSGQTGYPIVDAGMRQLSGSGWMHNRSRMIAASFLCKDLLINWQEGEDWFMRQLIDADLAANNGGWQWVAGVGTDAAPYFRIFNPLLQGKRFDPEGCYIRRWVPELANVPDAYIHEPWRMPLEVQRMSGCQIGEDYPFPIVDHHLARERTIMAYRNAAEK